MLIRLKAEVTRKDGVPVQVSVFYGFDDKRGDVGTQVDLRDADIPDEVTPDKVYDVTDPIALARYREFRAPPVVKTEQLAVTGDAHNNVIVEE